MYEKLLFRVALLFFSPVVLEAVDCCFYAVFEFDDLVGVLRIWTQATLSDDDHLLLTAGRDGAKVIFHIFFDTIFKRQQQR